MLEAVEDKTGERVGIEALEEDVDELVGTVKDVLDTLVEMLDDCPLDVEEEEELAAPEGRKLAATLGFDERKPAVKSPAGHPLLEQAFTLQQPMNGGVVPVQVY